MAPYSEKKLRNVKRLFIFSLKLLPENFLSVISQLENTINIRKRHDKHRYSCQILIKVAFSRHIFNK